MLERRCASSMTAYLYDHNIPSLITATLQMKGQTARVITFVPALRRVVGKAYYLFLVFL